MNYLSKVLLLLKKDIILEYQTKDTILTMFLFSLLVIVISSFVFAPSIIQEIIPGLIWITFIFAGMLGLNRSFFREQENACLEALILLPMDSSSIFFAKVLGNVLFLLLMELLILPLFFVFFALELNEPIYNLIIILVLTSLGFSSIGTLFAAMVTSTKSSDLLLPILLFPLLIPLLIAATEATKIVFGVAFSNQGIMFWISSLIVYDIVFIIFPNLLFEYILEV